MASGTLDAASPVAERPDIPGKLGLGEIVLTIVVAQAAKVALGMVFDELEKALLKFMQESRTKASLRVEVKAGDEAGQSQVVVVRRDIVVDKAVSLAMKTAREIAKGLIK
ncbi:hypothetical protein RA210_U600001 [Rubrivivax sp. A210]|nr:hypothetical protein RA210_U600001 [Rubrivivax sp. A210]